jgi:hypothetical protein
MDTTFLFLVSVGALAVVAIAATARSMATDGYRAISPRGRDEAFDRRL